MRILTPLVVIAVLTACELPDAQQVAPVTLADLSTSASALGLVDRDEALADAVDYHAAPLGTAVDLDRASAVFAVSGEGLVDTEDLPTQRSAGNPYSNIFAGAQAVVASEVIRYAVVTPPAIALAVASSGTVTQVQPNVWLAENTVELDTGWLTTHLSVSFVGVGWLAQMRVSDAQRDQALWFEGFVSLDGGLGWWDLFDDASIVAQVEWIADGVGNGQFGIAAVSETMADSTLQYTFAPDYNRIDAYDAAADEHIWVQVLTDESGEVRLPEYASGEVSCWGSDFLNTSCAQ